jgi:alkyl hydroperoxide reductase subunit AhpC
VLVRIHSDFQQQGVQVVAINIAPIFSLDEWISFWKGKGAGDVIWAQDIDGSAIRQYRLLALGTEVIVDREGRVAFRSDRPADEERLRAEIEKLLPKK